MNLFLRLLAGTGLLMSLLWPTTTFAEITDLSVRFEPQRVVSYEPFVLIIEGTADAPVSLAGLDSNSQFEGGGIDVYLLHDIPTRPAEPFRLEVDVDPGDFQLQNNELYELRILQTPTPGTSDGEELQQRFFALGEYFDHPLDPDIVVEPFFSTDNDNVTVLIPTRTDGCRFSSPVFERMEQQDDVFALFFRYNGYQLGDLEGLDHAARSEKCTPKPGLGRLDAQMVELGALEPGSYVVQLFIRSPESMPIWTRTEFFAVSDAPDVAELQDERFEVEVRWKDFEGIEGPASPVPGATDESTLFTFFGDDNWELLVKVLDGCALNDHYWVLGAAATTVEYTITITDTRTGQEWTYTNPLGVPSPAITDVTAFPCDVPL